MPSDEPSGAESLRPSASADAPRILLVGVGNLHRSDDAAGLEVARRLRDLALPGATVWAGTGDTGLLLDTWNGYDLVVLIDAVQSGRPPGEIVRLDATSEDLPSIFVPHVSSHGMGVAEAVQLARTLGTLPPALIVYAIEGENFDLGEEMSPQVTAAIDAVTDRIVEEVQALG